MQQSLPKKRPDSLPHEHPISDSPGSPQKSDKLKSVILASTRLNPRQIAPTALQRLKIFAQDDILVSRVSVHLTIILLIGLAVGLRSAEWSWTGTGAIRALKQNLPQPNATLTAPTEGRPLTLPAELKNFQDDLLLGLPVPHTIIPERTRPEILTYIVETGDTVFSIAAKFGLSPETLTWSNHDLEDNPDLLSVGQEVIILPVNGVYHQVGGGDTIENIAGNYKVEPPSIINYSLNGLDPDNLTIEPGQWLIVPGGVKPFVPRTVIAYTGPVPEDATTGSGAFSWPASGTIYQDYWTAHPGLDIADRLGAPVLAADSGYVVASGWDDTGYGYTVVLDHGNGYQTLYAHLQAYYVDAGANVTKGEQIAEMGSSGNATGPHVHFEIRQGTIQRNPHGFLP